MSAFVIESHLERSEAAGLQVPQALPPFEYSPVLQFVPGVFAVTVAMFVVVPVRALLSMMPDNPEQ